jgi:hypothetical protein
VATERSTGAAWRGVRDCFCWYSWFLRFYGIGTVSNSVEYSVATKSRTVVSWRGEPDCFRWFLLFYVIGTVGNRVEYS